MSKFIPTDARACVVKVTGYDNRVPEGSLYNINLPGEVPFIGFMDLFMRMDGVFDENHAPRTTLKRRSFTDEAPAIPEPEQEAPVEDPLATFRIRVHFRQNASWQGSVQWAEENTEAGFRSALELMYLMDTALAPAESAEE